MYVGGGGAASRPQNKVSIKKLLHRPFQMKNTLFIAAVIHSVLKKILNFHNDLAVALLVLIVGLMSGSFAWVPVGVFVKPLSAICEIVGYALGALFVAWKKLSGNEVP